MLRKLCEKACIPKIGSDGHECYVWKRPKIPLQDSIGKVIPTVKFSKINKMVSI